MDLVASGPVRSPEQVGTFGQRMKAKRAAQPEEIAPARVFLASDADTSFATGIVSEEVGGITTVRARPVPARRGRPC